MHDHRAWGHFKRSVPQPLASRWLVAQAPEIDLRNPVESRGRFNEFQRTMLQWSSLHPYTAVHVLKVAAPITPDRFAEGLNKVLSESGLGSLSIDRKLGTYHFHRGPQACVPRQVESGRDPMAALSAEIERQLNEPFAFEDRFVPFRFFILPGTAETHVGISYFHAIADAESIGRLLLEIVRSCLAPDPAPVPDQILRPHGGLMVPLGNPIHAFTRSWAALRKFQKMRNSYRPPSCEVNDFRNEFISLTFAQPETAQALTKARGWNVTLNDLCLAALLLAVAPLATNRFRTSRSHLSVGCVVNLRHDLKPGKRDDFGLSLGSFSITHPVPKDISLRELACDIRSETLQVKKQKLYLAAPLEFRVSRFMFGRMPVEKQRNFYRKSYPVWGSITNRKVDELCRSAGIVEVVDYFRAVSAGPAMPFVISVTGIDGRLNFGISYKPGVISADKMAGVIQRFSALLKEPGGAS